MDNNYYNTSYTIKSKTKKYISYNRYELLFLGLIFVVAVVTGIFTAVKGSRNISISNINDKSLIKFFKGNCGAFSFFFTRILKYLITLLAIFCLGKTRFCTIIFSIFLACMSYSLGLNCMVFMLLFGLGGTINAIIIIIPIRVCVLIVYIIAGCIAIKNSRRIKKYGTCCFDGRMLIKWFWFLLALMIITLFETILINVFSRAFIFDF